MIKALVAEMLGAFVWVSAVCGAMLVSGQVADTGLGILGTALCIGFGVGAIVAALGPVSGGHFNPAVTIGALVAGRVSPGRAGTYVLAQVVGASLAALVFFIILSTTAGYTPMDFAANGYGSHSPGGFSAYAVFAGEFILTALLVLIVLAATGSGVHPNLAPLFIGGAIAAFHLMSVPIDKTSLNPARSTATALFAEGWAVDQLWIFWLAPMMGGLAGGALSRWLRPESA
jgi:aquaporin Z